MPELGQHDYPVRKPEPSVDPGNKNLAAAIKAAIELLNPSDEEVRRFGAKLAANCCGG